MCEEILSEFIEELVKRDDPVPRDLIKKYRDLGLPESQIASALMAREALKGEDIPQSAMESSQERIELLKKQAGESRSAKKDNEGFGRRIRKIFGKD